jgi:hypothetical protein
MSLKNLIADPTNADAEANYTFEVQPSTKLSKGAEIYVVYPSEFKVLPANPDCDITGAINTFESCTIVFNSIVMK